MKTVFYLKQSFLLVSIICLLSACKKDREDPKADGEKGVLTLNVMADELPVSCLMSNITRSANTKAKGSEYIAEANDGNIETLEIFVFNNSGGAMQGVLDSYKKYVAGDDISSIQLTAPVGNKIIYAVANSHKSDWNGVTDIDAFEEQIASLKSEDIGNFTMTGSATAMLSEYANVTLSISRLIAKVILEELKTDFSGTPYVGQSLSNVKVYLTNVIGEKYIFDNSDTRTKSILNYKQLVDSDILSCSIVNMLCENIEGTVGSGGYSDPLYFFAYENILAAETTENRFTKLVIQADFNGKTNYYPIPINRTNYGHIAENGHYGVKRNTIYKLKVTIKRMGSDDPDISVQNSAFSISVTVDDWNQTATSDIQF